MRSSYKLKRNVLLLLSNILFMLHLNAQFVTLQGSQFKDQSGVDFYPMICNYNIIWAKETSTGNYFLMPSTAYGPNVGADCGSLSLCQQSIRDDFHEMKLLGFNTIRIGINISKDEFTSPKCFTPYGPGPHIYKNKFVLNYQIFPDSLISCGSGAYAGNGEAQRFLDITPPYDFATNANLQGLITPLIQVFSYAQIEGLKIILITGGGKFLLNNSIYPSSSSNTSISIHDSHVNDYAALLVGIAQALKNETALLAYDVWNEPAWHDEQVNHTKSQVCSISSQWYNAIRNVDHHHLITMGLSNFHDVLEWDPAVLKLDFLSEHMYPDAPSFEFDTVTITHDQTKLKDRYHAELLWLKRNAPMTWLIEETGFSASNQSSQSAADQVHLNGTEAEQAVFANFALNETRNAGSSGMSWWQFQDVHWYNTDAGSDYIQNWWGLLKRDNPNNGDYSALRKPCATEFQNFIPGALGSFDQSLNNVYYDPYDFANLNPSDSGLITGTVTAGIQPIQDALITAFNWTNTIIGGTPANPTIKNIGKTIYTFSDQSGQYTLRPYNYLTPNDNSSHRILYIKCSAIGCNRIDTYSSGINNALDNSNPHNFSLTQGDLTQSNSAQVIENQIINFNVSGTNYLSLNDDVILQGTNATIQAGKEINIGPEFEVKYGSEVHFFIENANANCIDFADVRTSNPNASIQNNEAKNDTKEIEVQFKKTGRQIIDAIIQPNPSDGIVYLNVIENTSNEALDIQVFNTVGQCIKTYRTLENSLLLEGIQWQKGVYFISIKNEKTSLIKKVIIN